MRLVTKGFTVALLLFGAAGATPAAADGRLAKGLTNPAATHGLVEKVTYYGRGYRGYSGYRGYRGYGRRSYGRSYRGYRGGYRSFYSRRSYYGRRYYSRPSRRSYSYRGHYGYRGWYPSYRGHRHYRYGY